MKSITTICKNRNLPDVLDELYQDNRLVYLHIGYNDNKRLLFSAFWPVPRSIILDLKIYSMSHGYDFDGLYLRIFHPIETAGFGGHRRFLSLKELEAKNPGAFLSDERLQLLIKEAWDGCYLVELGQPIVSIQELINRGGMQHDDAKVLYDKDIQDKLVYHFRPIEGLCAATTIKISAERLLIDTNRRKGKLQIALENFDNYLELSHRDWRGNYTSDELEAAFLLKHPEFKHHPDQVAAILTVISRGELRMGRPTKKPAIDKTE